MTLEELQVVIRANATQYEKEMAEIQSTTKKATDNISNIAGKAGAAVKAALAVASVAAFSSFSKSCIELGSDLSEVQNVVDVTFGSMSESVNQFAKNAIEQFGLSETAAKRYTSTMGAMLKSSGIDTSSALQMSEMLTGLSADMASFYNLDADMAFEKIRSGISGETEPLKQLGINMSVANLEAYALANGIDKAFSSMSQSEQIMLRYNYLLSVTADAQGDFARTSDGWANQVRVLQMRFEGLKASLGQAFIAVLTPVIHILNDLIAKLSQAAQLFADFVMRITGQDQQASVASGTTDAVLGGMQDFSEAADDAASSAESVGDATEDAMERAKRAVASFDQLHILSDPNSTNGKKDDSESGLAGLNGLNGPMDGIAQTIAKATNQSNALNPVLQAMIDRLKELAGLFKDGFKNGLGDVSLEPLKESLKQIKKQLNDIFADSAVVQAANGFMNKVAYALGQISGSFASVGITIATNLVGGFQKFLENNSSQIKLFLIDVFDVYGDIVALYGNIAAAIADIFSVWGGENGQRVTSGIMGVFFGIASGITELFGRVSRDTLIVLFQPILDNKDAIKQAFDDILGVFADLLALAEECVDYLFGSLIKMYDEHIKPLMDSIAQGLSDLLQVFLEVWQDNLKPALDKAVDKIKELYELHIKDFIDQLSDTIGQLADVVKVFWEKVLQPALKWIIKNVIPVIGDDLGVAFGILIDVLGLAVDAVTGLLEALEGLLEFLEGTFEGDWSKSWDGIKKTAKSAWDEINLATGNGAQFLVDKGLGALGWLKEKAVPLWDDIKQVFKGAIDYLKGLFNFDWSLPKIKLPHFTTTWQDLGMGVSIPNISVEFYAKGGFPDTGSLFWAREDGPELVGTMGGRNAVANNEQIEAGIEEAAYRGFIRALMATGGANNSWSPVIEFTLMVDSEELYRMTRRGQEKYDGRYYLVERMV